MKTIDKIIQSKWFVVVASLLVCCTFFIGYENIDNTVFIPKISNPIEMEKSAIMFFGIAMLLVALRKAITSDVKAKKISLGLAIFFAFCVVFGNSYEKIASWGYIFSCVPAFIISVMFILGYTIIFYLAICALFKFIFTYDNLVRDNKYLNDSTKWAENFLSKNSFTKLFLLVFIFWLPYLIIDYPAVIHADSGMMLSQYIYENLTNHHPVLQTLVWGKFVCSGYALTGSFNVGVFLFVLIQCLYGAGIVALLFDYVYKKGYPALIIMLSVIIIAIMPAFPRNATAVCKDSNYTFYVLFEVWLILKTIDNSKDIFGKKWYYLPVWVITILFVCFSRKNGVHLSLITLPFVLFYIRKNIKSAIALLIAIVCGFAVYFAGEYAITNIYEISNNDTRETYSIPFQQTARFVRDYPQDVTAEEREIIDTILDYNSLGESYSPELSNPVKDKFKNESTKEDFNAYLDVWAKQLFRHPTVYIQATLNGTYGYFYPNNIGYYKDLFFMTMCVDDKVIYAPEPLKKAADKLCEINMNSRNIPVIGLFSSLGFFVWCDLFITLYFVFFKKNKKFLIYNIPAIVTLLICIASPVNNTMRYGLPIMFLVPVLFCMCFNPKNKNSEKC